jgi:hypothetical protein
MKSPKLVRRLLSQGFKLIDAGRGRLVFASPASPLVYKVSWRTKTDKNQVEWDKYQSLSADQKKLVVPVLEFHKLIDGNSVLVQARAKPITHSTPEETAEANQIMKAIGVNDYVGDYAARNFGYYHDKLRILDIDSPTTAKP